MAAITISPSMFPTCKSWSPIPHRPGHEIAYHPGEVNARAADVFVINKVDTAKPEDIMTVRNNLRAINPNAIVIEGASPLFVDDPSDILR